ncbi:hypothetical protein [Aquimarina algiphila]|uniref:Uncharacterized protein n=1 Tax=Aquimarina algiphila TaxID=2047982 RepID=A0A554VJ94_9FLAO|nr:hypothetical protein [Aquimarina algiphila]TSE07932.1 hypothetical protein FOF46_14500 [Aquimarina algiphila]
MNKFLFLVCTFFSVNFYAQDVIKESDIVILNIDMPFIDKILSYEYQEEILVEIPPKNEGDETTYEKQIITTNRPKISETKYLRSWVRFKVIDIDDTNKKVILKAQNFTRSWRKRTFGSKKADWIGNKYNDILYTVNKDEFDKYATKYVKQKKKGSGAYSVGLLSLPFKARPVTTVEGQSGSLGFDTDFNLNSTLNVRLGGGKEGSTSLNFQMGAGIGSVGLDSNNASLVESTKTQDVATLTGLTGLMLEYDRVQFGIYIGVDYINNQRQFDWENNGNIWFGLGIGYRIFNVSISDQNEKQSQEK